MKITNKKTSRLRRILYKNRAVLRDTEYIVLSDENKVNLNAWIIPNGIVQNVGDYLSFVVVDLLCKKNNIDFKKKVKKTKHLYAIGSVLLGYQDATIWGSGFGYNNYTNSLSSKINIFLHKFYHRLDIRAVRGPETRKILINMGIDCPEIYGDPAILMPLFYKKEQAPNKKYVIIPHYSKLEKYKNKDHVIDTYVKDYRTFLRELFEAELVISSSLHGIILAEAYGIPAIMLDDTPSSDITKYKDWYYSTKRYDFPIAKSVEEALQMTPQLPSKRVIEDMQQVMLETFPVDLWE